MPLIEDSSYRPPPGFRNPHVQTIVAAVLRRVPGVPYRRERIETDDDDFLDLEWVRGGQDRAVVISHGLEGDAGRPYVRGMARALARRGFDVLAWHYRGCSGEPNRQLRSYHSGATDDLDAVVRHALRQGYASLALVGFSLGGNLTLKYVGERGPALDTRIRAAAALSVPVDLAAAADHLDAAAPALYRRRFLVSLRAKARAAIRRFPGALDGLDPAAVATLRQFDDVFTAPIHGFRDAADYYARSSSLQFLDAIAIPTLLLTAADDPFLPEACYPYSLARAHQHVHFEAPPHGGHVGFVAFGAGGEFWSEHRVGAFLQGVLGRG
ncbi:MAG: alpha/beta fold hydrolase [Rhodothermales bacterium]|nr:alpha/beta fold hydrolase [Rhodothermales bacterium]